MTEYLIVLAIALLPAAGSGIGSIIAETTRAPEWVSGSALHAAAGAAIALASVDLMPRILEGTPGLAGHRSLPRRGRVLRFAGQRSEADQIALRCWRERWGNLRTLRQPGDGGRHTLLSRAMAGNLQYAGTLLDASFTHLGFAMRADGERRKLAVAVLGQRR